MVWYMGLDTNNSPNGWDAQPWGTAIAVTQDEYDFASLHPDCVWDGETLVVPAQPQPVAPTSEQIISEMTAGLDAYYNEVAQRKRYDNKVTCAMRAGYVGPYQAEGIEFSQWLDACCQYGYQVEADVFAGKRALPTLAELIAELPVAPW